MQNTPQHPRMLGGSGAQSDAIWRASHSSVAPLLGRRRPLPQRVRPGLPATKGLGQGLLRVELISSEAYMSMMAGLHVPLEGLTQRGGTGSIGATACKGRGGPIALNRLLRSVLSA